MNVFSWGVAREPNSYDPHGRKKSRCQGQTIQTIYGSSVPGLEQELTDDPDKDFLLQGIANGFDIIDDNVAITPVSAKNQPSARPLSSFMKR